MKPQPRIITASQVSTYVHYLAEISDLQCRPSYTNGWVLAKDMKTEGGSPAQSYVLIWLEENGFVTTRHGKTNTYRLARPLSTISLVDMVRLVNMPQESPLVKLMTHNETLTLADLLALEVPANLFDYPGTVYAFDFLISLLSVVTHETQTTYLEIQSALGDYSRSYTYTVGALGLLARQGLVERQQRKGYRLYRPFNTLTVRDIIPVVSHRDTVFNKVMYLSRSLPLSLFV